jgi:hypothetical protein
MIAEWCTVAWVERHDRASMLIPIGFRPFSLLCSDMTISECTVTSGLHPCTPSFYRLSTFSTASSTSSVSVSAFHLSQHSAASPGRSSCSPRWALGFLARSAMQSSPACSPSYSSAPG